MRDFQDTFETPKRSFISLHDCTFKESYQTFSRNGSNFSVI